MAPSTDAVMGAVPEEKAGVGSAMNGVSRMVAGALGAAISHQPSAISHRAILPLASVSKPDV
jgi:hypothetical protein